MNSFIFTHWFRRSNKLYTFLCLLLRKLFTLNEKSMSWAHSVAAKIYALAPLWRALSNVLCVMCIDFSLSAEYLSIVSTMMYSEQGIGKNIANKTYNHFQLQFTRYHLSPVIDCCWNIKEDKLYSFSLRNLTDRSMYTKMCGMNCLKKKAQFRFTHPTPISMKFCHFVTLAALISHNIFWVSFTSGFRDMGPWVIFSKTGNWSQISKISFPVLYLDNRKWASPNFFCEVGAARTRHWQGFIEIGKVCVNRRCFKKNTYSKSIREEGQEIEKSNAEIIVFVFTKYEPKSESAKKFLLKTIWSDSFVYVIADVSSFFRIKNMRAMRLQQR